jgi:mannose-6-phosphate isomerase-like protein (cupin superfamily)
MPELDLTSTYLHLGTGPSVTPIPVTDDFWPTIDQRTELHRGRLVTSFEHDADWTVWEMHPEGDEVIVVQRGSVTFHLDNGTSTQSIAVAAPHSVVVPKGTWHTADVHEPGQILVITWGEGTCHRPRD